MSNNNILQNDFDRLREVQLYFTHMYKQVQEVLLKYDVKLIAAGGTLLGAVRHKGFIPWDDDFDVLMLRNDYDKFKSALQELEDLGYYLQEPDLNTRYVYKFLKLRKKNTSYVELLSSNFPIESGIFIDIFILENVPNNGLKRLWHGKVCNMLSWISGFVVTSAYAEKDDTAGKSPKEIVKHFLYRMFRIFKNPEQWVVSTENYYKKYQHLVDSRYVTAPSGRADYFGELQERTSFTKAFKHEFEFLEIYVPNDYQSYLTALYGDDYMVMPPEEKREYHHIIEVSLDDSFK